MLMLVFVKAVFYLHCCFLYTSIVWWMNGRDHLVELSVVGVSSLVFYLLMTIYCLLLMGQGSRRA